MDKSKLRIVRESRGLTTVVMSQRLGIGQSRYSMIETGQRPASLEIATKTAEILDVSICEIFLPQSFTVREV